MVLKLMRDTVRQIVGTETGCTSNEARGISGEVLVIRYLYPTIPEPARGCHPDALIGWCHFPIFVDFCETCKIKVVEDQELFQFLQFEGFKGLSARSESNSASIPKKKSCHSLLLVLKGIPESPCQDIISPGVNKTVHK